MTFLDDIFSKVWDISDWFDYAYKVVSDWGWPFYHLAPPLLYISNLFWGMLTPIAQFGDWVSATATRILEILNWDTIKSLVLGWLPDLERIAAWWSNWWQQILWSIEEWWSVAQGYVKGWIEAATEGFSELVAAWDNFTTVTLPTLVDFDWLTTWWGDRLSDIESLIDTAFRLREGFWAGWQEIRGQVTDFFSDPEDWLYKAVDRIIERFW